KSAIHAQQLSHPLSAWSAEDYSRCLEGGEVICPVPEIGQTAEVAERALQTAYTPPFLVFSYFDGREFHGYDVETMGHVWFAPNQDAFAQDHDEHLVHLNPYANHYYATELRLG